MQNPSTSDHLAVITPFPAARAADPYDTIARLMLARGWDATTAWALFDGLDVTPEYPARIAAAIDKAKSAS